MATTAPETTQAGLARPVPRRLAPGHRRAARDARARDRATADHAWPSRRSRTSRGPPPRPPAAQPAWADTSYAERAAVLRRAAEIYEAHRPEFGTWTQRETGAVHGKMHHEQNFAAGEINAAATMPFQPYGQLVPSVVPGRLSMLRRVPVGRHRRDHAVELADRARDARRRAGPRPRQRRHPQAGPPDAGLRRRGVRGRLPRGRTARGPAPRRPRWRRGRRGHRHRPQRQPGVVHRLDRGRAPGRDARGPAAQAGQPRARRQQRVRRPRRRGPRGGGIGRGVRLVPVPGPGVLRDRPPHRPPQHRAGLHRPAVREGGATPARRPVPGGRRPRADRQPEAARAGRRDRPALGRRRAPGSPSVARTRACSTARPS